MPTRLGQLHSRAQDPENVASDGWLASPKRSGQWTNLCEKMDAVAPKLGKRGPYKTKAVA
jgi:hypothetical protein